MRDRCGITAGTAESLEDPNMEPSMLEKTAAVLIGLAAGGGLAIGVMSLIGIRRPPTWLAMSQGALAALGLILLGYAAAVIGIPPMAKFALALFAIAATGGAIINMLVHRRHLLRTPAPLMIGDAFLAAVGFVLLLLSLYGQRYVDTLSPIVVNNS